MYSRYTTLQRAQLAKQEYLDTQDVFLAVYAPGRRASLEASLRDQLHRKFLLAEDLSSGSLGSARGVLLAKEDLSLMPTALSCFADALRSGADYVTSDAVFGYAGATALYHSPSFAAVSYTHLICAMKSCVCGAYAVYCCREESNQNFPLSARNAEILERNGAVYRKAKNSCNMKTAYLRYAIQRCCCCSEKLNCYIFLSCEQKRSKTNG